MKKHLWKIDHPYYCEESNLYKNNPTGWDAPMEYNDFDSFINDGWGSCDLDYNLLFRWDWEVDYEADSGNRSHYLKLFYFMQRKGTHKYIKVGVKKEDEEEVRRYLKRHWDHMRQLWEGLSDE